MSRYKRGDKVRVRSEAVSDYKNMTGRIEFVGITTNIVVFPDGYTENFPDAMLDPASAPKQSLLELIGGEVQ